MLPFLVENGLIFSSYRLSFNVDHVTKSRDIFPGKSHQTSFDFIKNSLDNTNLC